MKRLSNIIVCVWLSMLVVWLGGGIGMLRCEHSGDVEFVQLKEMAQMTAQDGGCCKTSSPCMHLKIAKLSPVTQVAGSLFCFSVPILALPVERQNVAPITCTLTSRLAALGSEEVWHGPPRLWLSIIRVLQI